MKNFAIKLSGPAGAGMMQAGEILSKALNRLDFYTLMYPEYPSRIRGGDNNVLVVFSSEKYIAPVEKIDLLLAFGKENFRRHEEEVEPAFAEASSDAKALADKSAGKGGYEGKEIGLARIAEELGNPLVANTAGLGFIFAVLGFELKVLEEQIKEEFKEKEGILKLNLEAARRGWELGQGKGEAASLGKVRGIGKNILNYSGNEALVEGILGADCGFAAIYPMTPINSILTMLAKSKIQLFRPEDEIAGIMAAIGASYAGKRAMVATSGGGFSLMIEGMGMAGTAEIPIVIIVGQRTGPSTGMATFSSQADLNFAIFGGHGEFPRIVLSPGDLKEAYFLGAEAFNLAEHYQVPVILLTDKYLAESRFSADEGELKVSPASAEATAGKQVSQVPEHYKRYRFTESGISPRAFPGQTAFLTNSYEHDEYGFSSDDAENRKKMMKKRMRKLSGLEGGYGRYGENGAKTTLVGWGSTKEIILDFLKDHKEFNYLHIWRPWPFPKEAEEILKKSKRIVCVEGNFSGQMADMIERLIFRKVERILKDDGRPFFKGELREKILNPNF